MSSTERTGIQRPGEAAQGVSGGLIERGEDERLSLRRLLVPAGAIALSLLYILGGLVWRQLYQSDYYDDKFQFQSSRLIQIPAPRGHIYDRNSKLIVRNRPRYNIVADLSNPDLRDKVHKTYLSLYRDARRRYEAGVTRVKPSTIAVRLLENARESVLQRYLDAVIRVLPGHREKVNAAEVKKHLASKRGLNFPLLSDIASEEVAVFIENFPEEYPLQLYVDSVRKYEFGDSAAHVLGYLSDTDDLGEDPDEDPRLAELKKLRYTGKTGKIGLELEFNDQLQGKPGSQVWRVKPNGYLDKKLSETKAEQGAHIHCSLDMDLQVRAEEVLAATKLSGSVIAIDVGTGEILAMASYPRFNPNEFAGRIPTKRYEEIRASGGLLNLATQGLYPPGSTFKVVTAIAGMRSGKLDPDEVLQCGSSFDIGGRLWPEHDRASFGEVNLERMLSVSCNVYCYQMGLRIGIDALAAEARRLGLDEKINIGIPTARKLDLNIPDAKWKKDHGYSGWSSGDTANTAIGQGFITTTPLHMAAMIASIAGNRTRTDLSLMHDPAKDGLNLSHHGDPLGLTAYHRQRFIDGLRSCVEKGTGKPVRVAGLDIVGKTGTAEFKDKKGNPVNLAWFEGFAPGDKPRIAVLVMLEGEHGGASLHGGISAGPIAKAVFEKWQAQQTKPAAKPAQ